MNPANLKRYMQVSRTVKVSDEFRTNNLSLTPGGSEISITLNTGQILVYDKIKSPKKYIQSLSNYKDIVAVTVNGEPFNF
jgi:hypothetical protein